MGDKLGLWVGQRSTTIMRAIANAIAIDGNTLLFLAVVEVSTIYISCRLCEF